MIIKFKIFERLSDTKFKVGDYVYPFEDVVGFFNEHNKYKIVRIYDINTKEDKQESKDSNHDFCDVEDKNGNITTHFWLSRFITEKEGDIREENYRIKREKQRKENELKRDMNKYNL